MFEEEVRRVKADIAQEAVKRETLRNLDCFILDNSIRESTVGQLCGHTLKNKWKIYEEVRKCGFNNIVVASFAHMTVVDDHFVQQLVESGEDRSTLFAFTEATAGVKNGVMDTKTLPIELLLGGLLVAVPYFIVSLSLNLLQLLSRFQKDFVQFHLPAPHCRSC